MRARPSASLPCRSARRWKSKASSKSETRLSWSAASRQRSSQNESAVSSKSLFPNPIAHRGLHDISTGVIENSTSAFEAAIAGGYAIECDVQLSSDGVPYIFHDDELDRLVGRPGRSDEISMAEVGALPLLHSSTGDRPQTFAQFLDQIAGRTLLQIELKRQYSPQATEALAREVTKALAAYGGPNVVESFDPNLLVAMRKAGYAGKLGIITYSWKIPEWDADIPATNKFALRHLLHWPLTRFDFISCHDVALELPAVRLFHALGVPVTTWTIKSAAQAEKALTRADQLVFEGFVPR
ncbi:MAG: glycerophosphodiester phosphodiesterase [Hyphomicrobiales bacterium]|nr:MAG: glycerophosphodiester phosphodiesterase [Hyphomicrobiales bacterium]